MPLSEHGEGDRGADAAAVFLEVELGAAFVEEMQTFAQVVQADAGGVGGGGAEGAGVFDGDVEEGVFDVGLDDEIAGAGGLADAMFDGVFDEGLEEQWRDRAVGGGGVDGDGGAETVGEADGFEGEIVGDGGEFGLERDGVGVVVAEAVAEDVRQAGEHVLGAGGVEVDEGADGVEGVEEEVGVELGFEGAELGFAEGELELGFAVLAGALVGEADVEEDPDADGEEHAPPEAGGGDEAPGAGGEEAVDGDDEGGEQEADGDGAGGEKGPEGGEGLAGGAAAMDGAAELMGQADAGGDEDGVAGEEGAEGFAAVEEIDGDADGGIGEPAGELADPVAVHGRTMMAEGKGRVGDLGWAVGGRG
jgi:hypothetical protein